MKYASRNKYYPSYEPFSDEINLNPPEQDDYVDRHTELRLELIRRELGDAWTKELMYQVYDARFGKRK